MKASKPVDVKPARALIDSRRPVEPSDLIPLLQALQEHYGYLPRPVLETVTEETGIPLSRVMGVATFYEQFSLTPRGRHIIRVCRGTACHVRGGARIAKAVADALGVSEGETTPDMQFTLYTVACLGTCFLAPAMMIDHEYYGQLTPTKVPKILDYYRPADEDRKGN